MKTKFQRFLDWLPFSSYRKQQKERIKESKANLGLHVKMMQQDIEAAQARREAGLGVRRRERPLSKNLSPPPPRFPLPATAMSMRHSKSQSESRATRTHDSDLELFDLGIDVALSLMSSASKPSESHVEPTRNNDLSTGNDTADFSGGGASVSWDD